MKKEDRLKAAFELIESEPVIVEMDRSVFFSGGKNRKDAHIFCRENPGYSSILMTRVWKRLKEGGFFKHNDEYTSDDVWQVRNFACRKFCLAASGNVIVFSRLKPQVLPRGTFFDLELSELFANDKVSTINQMPKEDFILSVNRPDLLLS